MECDERSMMIPLNDDMNVRKKHRLVFFMLNSRLTHQDKILKSVGTTGSSVNVYNCFIANVCFAVIGDPIFETMSINNLVCKFLWFVQMSVTTHTSL